MYLFCAVPLSRYLGKDNLILTLALSYLVLAASLLGQALAPGLPVITAWRVVMGLTMTACFVGLHALIAAIVHGGNAGATFGWFESSSKWGAVGAGLIAGLAVQALDLRAPFFISALVMFVAGSYLAGLTLYRPRPVTLSNRSKHASK
jgi:MFS family permease